MNPPPKALGRWPNAPLALVVAQVRFEPHSEATPELVSKRIQQSNGEEYPFTSALQSISTVIGTMPSPSVAQAFQERSIGLELRNMENDEVVRLQQDSLTFMTSAYQDSTQFSSQWLSFMNALCPNHNLRVIRLGLRYVDFILPSSGHTPEDYFVDGLGRSPAAFGEQSPVAFTLYDFPREDKYGTGQLRVQYGRGYGQPSIPPDLQDSVNPPARLIFGYKGGVSAVLDMDRWSMLNTHLSAEGIAETLDVLRLDMNKCFKKIISPLANMEWQTPTQGE